MTEMDFEKIRQIQRKEREETSLYPLEEDFYPSTARHVAMSRKEYEKNPGTEKLREIENFSRLAKDVFDKREQKIIMKSLRAARGSKRKDENMTPEEKKLFNALVQDITKHRKFFEDSLKGKTPKTLLNKNEHNSIPVRAVEEIPQFVGSDSKEYGPFKQNSIFKIPEKEAELLLKRNLIEKM